MAAKETWTASSLSRLVSLKPELLKAFIDNSGHRSIDKRFKIFYLAMEAREEDDEGDITARKLVEAWVDIAYTSSREDETSPGTLPSAGEWRNDPRYKGFFYTQRSLAERPDAALSSLNTHREKLGLSPVDSDHPCLVSPELSVEHRGLIVPSRSRQNPQVKSRKKSRRSRTAKGERKSQAPPRDPSIARNNKAVRPKINQPLPAPEKLDESDQETDSWSDIHDEPPQPDHRDNPAEPQPSEEDTVPDEVNVLQPMPKADRKFKRVESFNLNKVSASRSSMRLAVSKSLKQQTVVSPSTRPKPRPTLARKSKVQKLEKAQYRFDTVVASDPPFPNADSVAGKFERSESDEESDGIPPKGCVPLSRRVKTSAMDVDAQPPLADTSSYSNGWDSRDSKPSLINEEPALDAPPPEDATRSFEVPPLIGTSQLAGALPPPTPPSNESGSVAWEDSHLAQYVRIPVWAKSRQELCELPYFKSMQGGVYTRGGTVYGYLLGRFPSPRDAWCYDGRFIVSHGGGKNVMDEGESDPTKARHQLGDDQLESDKSVRALLTSYRMFRPIVILAEADYGHLQKFNLRQGYAEGASYYVLGHYAIVAAWAEHEEVMAQGFIHTRWKFAFQYIEGNQGPPWWLQPPGANINRAEPLNVERVTQASERRRTFGGLVSGGRKRVSEVTTESFTGVPSIDCNECRTLSPRVYALGPICLNPDCSSFWKLNGLPVSQAGLTFNPDFLSIQTGNIEKTVNLSLIVIIGLEHAAIAVAEFPAEMAVLGMPDFYYARNPVLRSMTPHAYLDLRIAKLKAALFSPHMI
ncbi:hypothetical protein RSAG8_09288, partial [Rhizoctonia solani AG-8 WAC10335]